MYYLHKHASFLIVMLISMLTSNASTHVDYTLQSRVLSQEDGLSNHKVTAIAEDKYGTFWIGTRKGLNRIVEDKVKQYNNNDQFRNKEILFIFKDSLCQIWVATRYRLYRYEYSENKFHTIKHNYNNIIPSAYSLAKDGVIFSTSDGIFKYNYSTQEINVLVPRDFSEPIYSSINILNDSTIIVSNDKSGVSKLDLKEGKLTQIHKPERDFIIKDIFVDSKQRLWIAQYNKGLFCYSIKYNKLLKLYSKQNSQLNNNIILTISEFKDKIWIGTDGGGVSIIDYKTDKIELFHQKVKNNRISKIDAISAIFITNSNNEIWLGSVRHGVVCVQPNKIRSIDKEELQSNTDIISNPIILSINEDYDKNIWFGTDGGGLNRYNTKNGQIYNIRNTYGMKVTAIENIDKNNLLISVYSNGIYKFNKITERLEQLKIIDENDKSHITDRDIVLDLKCYDEDNIYIIANNIYIYNISTNSVRKAANQNINNTHSFSEVYTDKEQTIYHNFYNICSIDNTTHNITSLYQSISGDIITACKYKNKLFINKDHSLIILHLDTNHVEEIASPYNHHLLSMLIDSFGRLWCTTYNKLICIDTNNMDNYTTFDSADGLSKNEYFPEASFVTSDGNMYFGGNAGFCIINKFIPTDKRKIHDISILSITVDDNEQKYAIDLENNKLLEVPWSYQSIEISVCLKHGNIFRKNRYKYTIKDLNKETVIYSNNTLSLPVLSPGLYKVNVSYLNKDDKWSDSVKLISIIVQPPLWKSLFIQVLIYIIICVLALVGISYYFRNKKRQDKNIFKENERKLADNKIKFLINISHELRTPLTLIYAPLKRILEMNKLNESAKFELTNILSQTKYMIRLVNMVLDMRVMEAGHGEVVIRKHDFNEWIKQVSEEFRMEYENKSMELEYDFDDKIKTLNFDSDKCKTVLSNLLMNAYKYSKSNTRVIVKSKLHGQSVKLYVIDQGMGLKGVNTSRLFDRFIQAHDKSLGSGIGLSYSKLLIELHPNAMIGVSPNEDVGSTFYFEIPTNLECCTKACEQGEYMGNIFDDKVLLEKDINNVKFDTSKLSILVVEDEPELLHLIESILKPYFSKVIIAQNGVEALELTEKNLPDVIISDVMMPLMDGYELCEKVKNDINKSHIPVILLTAKVDSESQSIGYKSGADVFISKPFDAQTLLSVIYKSLINREEVKNRYKQNPTDVAVKHLTFSNPDEQFMIKLNDFINSNITNEELNVQSMVEHMYMSRAVFYKKLKAIVGTGGMEYVTKRRLFIAANKLEQSFDSISNIASSVGYSDNQHFSKMFKQHYKKSPSQYRKDMRTMNG